MPVTHTLVSALPDNAADAAAGLVVSSDRNDSHAIARREYVIGDRRFIFLGDGDLEQMLVQRISAPVRVARVPKSAPAIPVNVEPTGPLETWGPADIPLTVDMRAVNVIREQSRELGQQEVIDALDRVVKRIRRIKREIEEDDADIESMVMFL